jgi:hypothetical protein
MSLLQALKLPPLPQQASQPAPTKSVAEAKTAAPAVKTERLSQAAEAWRQTHGKANEQIMALKQSVKAHYAGGHPELLQEIEKGLVKLDEILNNVDHRLADSLANAGKAADDDARKAELKTAKSLFMEYVNYVKSEPLIAHIDGNPFGVKTNLKALLAGGLTDAAKAMA